MADKELRRQDSLNLLILNYLISEGYENAAFDLGSEMGLDLANANPPKRPRLSSDVNDLFSRDSIRRRDQELLKDLPLTKGSHLSVTSSTYKKAVSGLGTIKIRNTIKTNILNGVIRESIELVNEHFPTLLERNQLVYFKLAHLQLVEIIRKHHLEGKRDEGSEREFLDDVLRFIRTKLSTPKILSNGEFIKELEITMALLCYGDLFAKGESNVELPAKLKHIFDLQLRSEVASLVNSSILQQVRNADMSVNHACNIASETNLESLIRLWFYTDSENVKALPENITPK